MNSELQWTKFKVGSDGFICYVDSMGTDASIVQAARVSYGAGTKQVSDDRTLIRYLMRHRHTTPFEMCEIKFLVRVPMDTWRQWIRHRTANVNEYSTRYSEAIDSMAETRPSQWRQQSSTNKQGSAEKTEWVIPEEWKSEDPETLYLPGSPVPTTAVKDLPAYLSMREEQLHDLATDVYRERLQAGVAREQARKDLPLSNYTEAYWKCDLHNIFHFLALRLHPHAQLEIREFAEAMAAIVRELYPIAWEAFEDYRLNAVYLTAKDVKAIKKLQLVRSSVEPGGVREVLDSLFDNLREKRECEDKLSALGLK